MKHTQLTNHGAHLGGNKPEAPPFQLPPPPPGMQWHENTWEAEMLPKGIRPLCRGETIREGDEYFAWGFGPWKTIANQLHGIGQVVVASDAKMRTRRPLTFEHAGKTWTWHRPGDPMPCDGERKVACVFVDHEIWNDEFLCAHEVNWGDDARQGCIIGWRYADEKKTVPLGPEDVPPGSVLQKHDDGTYYTPLCVSTANDGVYLHDTLPFQESYEDLSAEWKINRSIPLTGKWDANAWEPCSKEVLP